MNVHDLIGDLCQQARRLAPTFAEQTLDACNSSTRPEGPRQAAAWDLTALAFDLNHVSDETSDAAQALRLIAQRGSRYGTPTSLVTHVHRQLLDSRRQQVAQERAAILRLAAERREAARQARIADRQGVMCP